MKKNIIEFFVRQSSLVNVLCLAVVAIGLVKASSLTRHLMPEVPSYHIKISADLPGATAEKVERAIGFPIEYRLKDLVSIESITSTSSTGAFEANIYLQRGSNPVDEVLEHIKSRVSAIRYQLPSDLEPIRIMKVEQDKSDLAGLYLTEFDPSNQEHIKWLKVIEERLGEIDGIAEVKSDAPLRDVYVKIDHNLAFRHKVTVQQVGQAIQKKMGVFPLGPFETGGQLSNVDIQCCSIEPKHLAATPVVATRTHSTLVSDIGRVEFGFPRDAHFNRIGGKTGVFLQVWQERTSDSIKVGQKIEQAVQALNASLPAELQLTYAFKAYRFVEKQFDSLITNAIMGFILVFVVLSLFTGFNSALMAVSGVMVAYLGTTIVLGLLGINFNLLTVMAMIIIVGVLVDDSIIVTERYAELLTSGLSPREAASNAALSLVAPVTATVLTTIIAFSPLIILDNSTSDWFSSVSIIVITSLMISWFECFFVLPNHLSHFAKKPRRYLEGPTIFLTSYYKKLLGIIVRLRYIVMVMTLALSILSIYYLADRLSLNMDLDIGFQSFTISVAMNQNLRDPDQEVRKLENSLLDLCKNYPMQINLVKGHSFVGSIPQYGSRFYTFSIWVNIDADPHVAKNVQQEIESLLDAADRTKFEELEFNSSIANFDKNAISIYVYGRDDYSFSQIKDHIESDLRPLEGYVRAYYDNDWMKTSQVFVPDLKRLQSYGLGPEDISRQLGPMFQPNKLADIWYKGDSVKIYLELTGHSSTGKKASLDELYLISKEKTLIPLNLLGQWQNIPTPQSIRHLDGKRAFKVRVRYDKEVTTGPKFRQEIAEVVKRLNQTHPELRFTTQSSVPDDADQTASVTKVLILSMVLILAILIVISDSLILPWLVALPLPLAILAIGWALFAHDLPLTLTGIIGIIGVIGIGVNDSLIMIHALREDFKQRIFDRSKFLEKCASRVRPILITTATTVAGLLPMAYNKEGTSAYIRSIAFSMSWGLSSSMFATLFIVPITLYIVVDLLNIKAWIVKKTLPKQAKKSTNSLQKYQSQ